MSVKDFSSLVETLGPTEQHRKDFGGTFFGTLLGQSVVLLGLVLCYVAAIALLYRFAGQDLRTFHNGVGALTFWSVMTAPAAVIFVFSMLPTLFRLWRERRLYPLATSTSAEKASQFRLHAYGPQDRNAYRRPDGAVEQVLTWLKSSEESVFYLAGASGAGKSSLIAAGVLPVLRDEGWEVRETRILGDAGEILRSTLLEAVQPVDRPPDLPLMDLLTQIGETRRKADLPPILIVIDQFEEFLILDQAKDRREFNEVLRHLGAERDSPVKLLLVFRDDYRGLLFKLGLPDYVLHRNAFELASFNRIEAEVFLKGGRQTLDQIGYDLLFKGLDRIEDTRGLYRPITLNMVGLVLERRGGHLEKNPGKLIETYLRDCLAKGRSQDFAKQVLNAMITAEGTKEPRTVAELAALPGIEEWQVRATLSDLRGDGLVRQQSVDQERWEISHDFLARVIGQILGRLRPHWIRRLAPVAVPVAAVGWAAVLLLAVPLWLSHQEDRALAQLREIGVTLHRAEGGIGLRLESRSNFRNNDLKKLVGQVGYIRDPIVFLDLTRSRVKDLTPLEGLPLKSLALRDADGITDLTPLKSMALASLDLRDADGITDLAPLKGMPLTSLNLADTDGITDLSPLQGMPLRHLSLTDADRIVDLAPLTGMPLTSLSLVGADGITDIGPLRGMPLTKLDLSVAKGITDLTPLEGMPLADLSLRNVDGITDLAPLEGMPLTKLNLSNADGITDLAPLKGMPLTDLDLSQAKGITDLAPLEGMPLTDLNLRQVKGVTSLAPLKSMPLKILTLSNADGITDLTPLKGMPLFLLDLLGADGITDLSPLKGMRLKSLNISQIGGITDLAPLEGMPLARLYLSFAHGITDLSPLKGMPLELLEIYGVEGITDLAPLKGTSVSIQGGSNELRATLE